MLKFDASIRVLNDLLEREYDNLEPVSVILNREEYSTFRQFPRTFQNIQLSYYLYPRFFHNLSALCPEKLKICIIHVSLRRGIPI